MIDWDVFLMLCMICLPGLYILPRQLILEHMKETKSAHGSHDLSMPPLVMRLYLFIYFLAILSIAILAGLITTHAMDIHRTQMLTHFLNTETPWFHLVETEVEMGIEYGINGGIIFTIIYFASSKLFFSDDFARHLLRMRLSSGLWGRLTGMVIIEELIVRFGALNILLWFFQELHGSVTYQALIVSVLCTSLMWSLSRLPYLRFVKAPTTNLSIFWYCFLDTLRGSLFAWVYWVAGIESAIIAHLCFEAIQHLVDIIYMRQSTSIN